VVGAEEPFVVGEDLFAQFEGVVVAPGVDV
jgi:hypothetical protein